jgi:hypothetical protein
LAAVELESAGVSAKKKGRRKAAFVICVPSMIDSLEVEVLYPA